MLKLSPVLLYLTTLPAAMHPAVLAAQALPPQVAHSAERDTPEGPVLTPQLGHTDSITSVTPSPDGRHLLSLGGYVATVWNVQTRRELRSLKAVSPVREAAWAPDSRRVAIATERSIVIWDTATRDASITFEVAWARTVTFARDGNRLLAQTNLAWQVFDLTTGRSVIAVNKGDKTPTLVAAGFSRGDAAVVDLSDDGSIHETDLATRVRIERMPGRFGDEVTSGAIGPEAKTVAMGTERGRVAVWTDGVRSLHDLQARGTAVTAVTLSGDGRYAGAVSGGRHVIWAVATGRRVRTWTTSKALIPQPSMRFTADAVLHVDDSAIVLSSLLDGVEVMRFGAVAPAERTPTAAAVSPDGKWAVTYTHGKTTFWHLPTGRRRVEETFGSVFAFTSDSRRLIVGGPTVSIWDVASAREITDFETAHDNAITQVAIAPDNRWVLSGDYSGEVILWDAARASRIRKLTFPIWEGFRKGTPPPVECLRFTPDGRGAITIFEGGTAYLSDLESGAVVKTLRGDDWRSTGSCAISPSSRFVAISDGKTANLWDLEAGTPPRNISAAGNKLALTETRLISGDLAGHLRQWTITGEALPVMHPHPASVQDIAVGGFIATIGWRDRVILWKEDPAALLRVADLFGVYPDGSWAVVRPDSYDSSGPVEWLHWVTGDETHPLAAFAAGRKRPGAITEASAEAATADRPESHGPMLVVQTEHSLLVTALAYSEDGRQLVSADGDGRVMLWDTETARLLRETAFDAGTQAGHVCMTPDNRTTIAAGFGKIMAWDVAGLRLWEREAPVIALGCPKGSGVAIVEYSSTSAAHLSMLDALTGATTSRVEIGTVEMAAKTSADGLAALVVSKHGVEIWSTLEGKRMATLASTSGSDASNFAVADAGRTVVEVRAPELLIYAGGAEDPARRLPGFSGCAGVMLSRLASVGAVTCGDAAKLIRLDGEPAAQPRERGLILPVAFTFDEQSVAAHSGYGLVQWSVAGNISPRRFGGFSADQVVVHLLDDDNALFVNARDRGWLVRNDASPMNALWDLKAGGAEPWDATARSDGNERFRASRTPVAFSEAGQMFASELGGDAILQIDVRSHVLQRRLPFPAGLRHTDLKVDAAGRFAISVHQGNRQSSVLLWDLAAQRTTATLQLRQRVDAAAISRDGQHAAIQTNDHALVLYDVASGGKCVRFAAPRLKWPAWSLRRTAPTSPRVIGM